MAGSMYLAALLIIHLTVHRLKTVDNNELLEGYSEKTGFFTMKGRYNRVRYFKNTENTRILFYWLKHFLITYFTLTNLMVNNSMFL